MTPPSRYSEFRDDHSGRAAFDRTSDSPASSPGLRARGPPGRYVLPQAYVE